MLPDLFGDGQGVVAEGALDASGIFRADAVLAKHDENYMPREVTDALKNQGHWRATPLETRVTNLNNYDWIKALHVVAVMIWMAGMLPWLFVLHGDAAFGSCTSEFLKVVERRLLRAIVNPAMILAWIAGPYLAWSAHWWTAGWFQTKFALVLALSGVHGLYARWVKDFAADRPRKSRGTYLGAALIPTVVMIAAVVLVVVKPF